MPLPSRPPRRPPCRHPRAALFALAALPLALSQAMAAQTTVTWTGAASGQYDTAGNWTPALVPLNLGAASFVARVGPNKAVNYGVADAQSIDRLLLDLGASFNLKSTSLFSPTDLTLLQSALIGGSVNADHAAFTALAAGTDFLGSVNTLSAINGAVVKLAGSNFGASGLAGRNILNAAGAGSLLSVAGVQTLDSGFVHGGGASNTVTASNKAVLRLADVITAVAPLSSRDALSFSATGAALIDLSSLQTVSGATLDSGSTTFSADGASILLGPLQKANRMFVTLNNGATLSAGGSSGVGDISNSTFSAAAGAVLDAGTLKADYGVQGPAGTTLLSATGAGTQLKLSGLRSINAGFTHGGGVVDTVSATDKGRIDLSGVTALVAPVSSRDGLTFNATGGAAIDLSSLQSVAGATLDTGSTAFNADGASIVVGPVRKANRMFVSLNNGATMRIGGYDGVASLSNGSFTAAAGSTLDAGTLKADYSVQALAGSTFINASGRGTLLNLSGLRSIDSGFVHGGGVVNTVQASSAATVNLNGVQTVTTPISSRDALTFSASSGGLIQLGALQSPTTANRGQVNFNVATGGLIQMHGINADAGVHFNLVDAGSQIAVAGKLALLAGSTLSAGKATRLDLGGSLSFEQKIASQMDVDQAYLDFNGAGLLTLEVGGKQLGAQADRAFVDSNFGIGELSLGRPGAGSMLQLVDTIDNGNRGGAGGFEVLYLNGINGGNGLHLAAGSTLVIGTLNLYTTEAGHWLHVNDLFTQGATRIAYDQGYIVLEASAVPEPGGWALLLSGVGALALRRRRPGPR